MTFDTTFEANAVRSATNNLSFAEVQALWLVDVCACSYGDAADLIGVERDVMSGLVRDARRSLRQQLTIS